MNPDDALEKMEQSRQALFDVLEGISPSDLAGPKVEGEWTIKDLLVHIASWEVISKEAVLSLTGRKAEPLVEDINAWNQEFHEKHKDLSPDEAKKFLARSRLELLAAMENLSEQQWEETFQLPWGPQGNPDRLLEGLAWHEMEHVKTIQTWKKNRATS